MQTARLAPSSCSAPYGLAWFLYRKDGSEEIYIGGFRAGPSSTVEATSIQPLLLPPKWRNVGIESVAFDGSDSIALRVPRLEPGTYRISGAFYKKTGAPPRVAY